MLIGRKSEQEKLLKAYHSSESEFVAIYGRRRVGKTYLVNELFGNRFAFQHTGLAKGNMRKQLQAFSDSLTLYGKKDNHRASDWFEAFVQLRELLSVNKSKRRVVFLDELPWMDTARSDFITALEHFWNGWASAQKNILLIVCGSATSWIIRKIICDYGGLHNRITEKILVQPFTLEECEEYASHRKLALNRLQLLEGYMVLGGIPYYWKFLDKKYSIAQNIDRMFFQDDGELTYEFDALYASLFKQAKGHIAVVTALAQKGIGLSRKEIAKQTGLSESGALTKILEELQYCGFIRKYSGLDKINRDAIYQLIDNFTLFYFQIVKTQKEHDPHYWTNSLNSSFQRTWRGLAFERVCLLHIEQIKKALGITGVVSNAYSWRGKSISEEGNGAQIDLLIDRKDQVINLCEMKFSEGKFILGKAEDENIRNKRELFLTLTKTTKAIHLTLVTTFAPEHNSYLENIHSVVTLDDLFEKSL